MIPNDRGFNRKLPKLCDCTPCAVDINERNILTLIINGKDELMIKDMVVSIHELKSIVKEFVDNNGDNSCTYC